MFKKLKLALLVMLPAASAAEAALAQDYPTKPIRMVVAVAPAGPTDILARMIGQKLTDSWGQPVIIDNRPGGGQVIGTDIVAKSQPDGYTLLMSTNTFAVNPALFKRLPYDPQRDFTPITLVAEVPLILAIHPSVPASTVKELIAVAKARPGQLNYGSSGTSSSLRLAAELMQSMVDIQMVHVPYKGTGPATTALVGGHVQLMFTNPMVALSQVKAGKLRALAITSARRSDKIPELPTMSEAGLPGYTAGSWFGLMAPAKTSPATVDKLHGEVVRILRMPNVQELMAGSGANAIGNTPQEFSSYIRADMAKWAKVIRASGITAD
ncbi:MAG: tripartite tricarboxylate transporter substrate binding protein [Betaproteobacteria bacterium]|nr:tripartite tricarboxylate transporter substrate binding protein [Betaproteobacteria bacterium]